MATEQLVDNRRDVNRAVEVSTHLGLIFLLFAACFLILRPFISLIVWGIIIAISIYPAYRKLRRTLRNRGGLSSVLISLLLLTFLVCPVILLAGTLVGELQSLAAGLRDGSPIIPPPPANIETWPVVGVPLKSAWSLAYTNTTAALKTFAPQIRTLVPSLLAASAGVGFAVLQFALSIVVAGILLAKSEAASGAAHSFANRIFGERAQEFERLASSTIRSVTTGILGVALIQAVLAAAGFLVAGLPGAGLWGIIFLAAAVLQVAVVVLIPAVIYMFAIASVTKATIFAVWCLFVAVIDNVLKPLLLGRGVDVPIAVVFLGAIGGFVAMGIIGLFVGAIALSVGYKLFAAWLDRSSASSEA